MLAELFFVTAQACQNGQCPPTVQSSVTATTVTVINSTQVAPVVFVAAHWYEQYAKRDKELQSAQTQAKTDSRGLWSDPNVIAPRLARWRFPNIFHRPIAIGCYGGKCK